MKLYFKVKHYNRNLLKRMKNMCKTKAEDINWWQYDKKILAKKPILFATRYIEAQSSTIV